MKWLTWHHKYWKSLFTNNTGENRIAHFRKQNWPFQKNGQFWSLQCTYAAQSEFCMCPQLAFSFSSASVSTFVLFMSTLPHPSPNLTLPFNSNGLQQCEQVFIVYHRDQQHVGFSQHIQLQIYDREEQCNSYEP